ncbi:hypothetical protein, partial [Comamonas suwonensis]|uniref:hypothetical protein n=1 Tax=Comamonas suwonensis TaxID=2606214 RepID=UPI001A7E780E
LAILTISSLAGCGNHKEELEACHKRGIAYFEGTPSYPYMQSEPNKGRRTADVVWERCNRATTAF